MCALDGAQIEPKMVQNRDFPLFRGARRAKAVVSRNRYQEKQWVSVTSEIPTRAKMADLLAFSSRARARGGGVSEPALRESENQLLSDLSFQCEQRLGRLTRSGHPLAIIAARMRVLPSAKQDLL
jgi:hypothetical protein